MTPVADAPGLRTRLARNRGRQRELYGAPLGDRLRRLTAELGITQGRLAQTLGVSPAMLSQLASARRVKIGDPAVLARLQLLDHRCAAGPPRGRGGRARLETPADPGALAGPGALADRTPADLGSPPPAGRVREETISRLQQAMGSLGTAAMTSMEERLPWFRGMSAENRSWVGLVAQAGIAAFVDWVKHPERSRSAVAGEVFGTAPRELARAVSLQQVVEMVRVTIDVVEARVDELAAPGGEAELREAVLHYTREVAFAAARVYARTAEARGAWDARLEALVVDSLVRGEVGEGVHSWASALNWSSSPVAVIVGTAEGDEPEVLIDELRATARRARRCC